MRLVPALIAVALLLGSAAQAEELFATTCGACHGPEGLGTEGFAPPLANPGLWQGLGPDAPRYLANVMLGGMSGTLKSKGHSYQGLIMPPQGQQGDEKLAELGTYVLHTLGQTRDAFSEADLAAARQAPLTHQKLRALREKSNTGE